MNERIKQLAEQAEYLVNEVFVWDPTGPDREDVIREKFAELIVRECADIAKGEPASFYDRDAYKLGRKFASEDVLKHFGVTE